MVAHWYCFSAVVTVGIVAVSIGFTKFHLHTCIGRLVCSRQCASQAQAERCCCWVHFFKNRVSHLHVGKGIFLDILQGFVVAAILFGCHAFCGCRPLLEVTEVEISTPTCQGPRVSVGDWCAPCAKSQSSRIMTELVWVSSWQDPCRTCRAWSRLHFACTRRCSKGCIELLPHLSSCSPKEALRKGWNLQESLI